MLILRVAAETTSDNEPVPLWLALLRAKFHYSVNLLHVAVQAWGTEEQQTSLNRTIISNLPSVEHPENGTKLLAQADKHKQASFLRAYPEVLSVVLKAEGIPADPCHGLFMCFVTYSYCDWWCRRSSGQEGRSLCKIFVIQYCCIFEFFMWWQ